MEERCLHRPAEAGPRCTPEAGARARTALYKAAKGYTDQTLLSLLQNEPCLSHTLLPLGLGQDSECSSASLKILQISDS